MTENDAGPASDRHRATARAAFEAHVPRCCDEAWLERVSGPARYGWDVPAMQDGLITPIYEAFDADEQLLVPSLAAALLEAAELEPQRHWPELAAAELQVLAVDVLRDVENERDAASAVGGGSRLPLSVLAAVSFTARQFAPVLVAEQATNLSVEARSWLAYRHGRALVNGGIGRAINTGSGLDLLHGDDRKLGQLYLLTSLNLSLATDVLTAALGLFGREEADALDRCINRLGISYKLASDLIGERPPGSALFVLDRRQPQALADLRSIPLAPDERARLINLVRRQRTEAMEELDLVPELLRRPLAEFAEQIIDPLLSAAEEPSDAKRL